jgi:hypothetical protein
MECDQYHTIDVNRQEVHIFDVVKKVAIRHPGRHHAKPSTEDILADP